MEIMKNSVKKARESLSIKLNLAKPDQYSQDWEFEVADSFRIKEFVLFYQTEKLDPAEKNTLMMIIIESCNDAVSDEGLDDLLWKEIETILISDNDIQVNTIQPWLCDDTDDIQNCFFITPLIRAIDKIMKSSL